MKPVKTLVGRVNLVPYDPTRNRLVFADTSTDWEELLRWRQKLPSSLHDSRWRYENLPRPYSAQKLYRLIAFTKFWRPPPAKKIHTLLPHMVRDRLFDKQGDALNSVPQYYQVCMAFTGFVLGLYYALGIRLGALLTIDTRRAPLAFSVVYNTASLNTPRGP